MKKELTKKQNEILDIAVNLFHSKGYADTSMRDIAEVMKIRAASLYAHIKSKEEIFEWIGNDVETRFSKIIEEVTENKLSDKEAFELLVRLHVQEISKNTKIHEVFFTNIYWLDVNFSKREKYLKNIDFYRNFAENAAKNYILSFKEKLNADVELVSGLGIFVLNNVFRYLRHKENADIEITADFLLKTFLYGAIGKS